MKTQDKSELPHVLTAEEARMIMRKGRSSFYESLARGDLPFAKRVGRQWRIGRDALMQWLAQEQAGN